jgi:hypothetical protein
MFPAKRLSQRTSRGCWRETENQQGGDSPRPAVRMGWHLEVERRTQSGNEATTRLVAEVAHPVRQALDLALLGERAQP